MNKEKKPHNEIIFENHVLMNKLINNNKNTKNFKLIRNIHSPRRLLEDRPTNPCPILIFGFSGCYITTIKPRKQDRMMNRENSIFYL